MAVNNLYNKEAKAKIKELAKSIDFAMMATDLKSEPFHAIPMSTKKVDENGSIWFLSGQDSDHNANIRKEGRTQLIYSQPKNFEFMTVYGQAVITKDKAILKELYQSSDDNWFEGVDDPNLTAIEVRPQEAHYWDTKHGKLVSLMKIAVGTVTGNEPDLSEEGDLKV